MENNIKPTKWYQKKIIIIPLVLFLFFTIVSSLGSKPTNSNSTNSAGVKIPKEGDTLLGISREEVDKKYTEANKASKLKADDYLKSVKGQPI